MYYVYILKGTRYYVGYTNNIQRRFAQHQNGNVVSTSKYGKLELIGYFACNTKEDARELEQSIKQSKNIERWIGSEGFLPQN